MTKSERNRIDARMYVIGEHLEVCRGRMAAYPEDCELARLVYVSLMREAQELEDADAVVDADARVQADIDWMEGKGF